MFQNPYSKIYLVRMRNHTSLSFVSAQERLDENLKTLKDQVDLKLSGDMTVSAQGELLRRFLIHWIIKIYPYFQFS